MDIEKYLKSQKDITLYKIIDNKTIYYSTTGNLSTTDNNDAKFWGKLFDLSYQKMGSLTDASNSTEVWKNSYDGLNFSEEEMSDWLNDTISRINKLICKDCNVLEIGSGNGLIFNSIIDNVSGYTGTDIAEKGLELIANSEKGKLNANKMDLYQIDALNVDKIPSTKFDLIIINSVAQYFPSLDYLFSVFKKLKEYTSENSLIFLGDIRSFELQKLFYLDILQKKNSELNSMELKSKINFLEKRENETFYNAQLFNLFPNLFDYISDSAVELKKGLYDNELNRYRYDVTLMCNKIQEDSSIITVNWENIDVPELEVLQQIKKIRDNVILEIINIPNDKYINIANKYNKLFNNEDCYLINNSSDKKDSIVTSISFFTELARQENVFVKINFDENDFFMFTVQFSRKKSFNMQFSNDKINYNQLSNKLEEKKTEKDKELEEKIQEVFPDVELIKISNYLLRE